MTIWVNPERVVFGSTVLEKVRAIRLERRAERFIIDGSTEGPYIIFADASEIRTELIVEREPAGGVELPLIPGGIGVMRFEVARGRSDGLRREISLTAMVLKSSIAYSRDRHATATERFLALSADGVTDPLTIREIG